MAAVRAFATACSLLAAAHCQMLRAEITGQTVVNNSTFAKAGQTTPVG